MLGNWSLGDYFKKEAIEWSYELLTSKKEGFGLDPQRLYVTCFEGDENAPKDEESAAIWKAIFEKNNITGERIYFLPAEKNWWSPGDNGPCGPDTEMFYDVTGTLNKGMTKAEFLQADNAQRVVEIWNDVFMEFKKKDGKVIGKLEKKNVDTGAGLERTTAVIQGKQSVFETDLFEGIIQQTKLIASDLISERIIADHFRASVFLIADGVTPANTDQGYILRRLIRRAIVKSANKIIPQKNISALVDSVVDTYSAFKDYKNLETKREFIKKTIQEEAEKFDTTLHHGLKQFEKLSKTDISGKDAFVLFSTYGFPLEITLELAKEQGIKVETEGFKEEFKKHQDLSRTGSLRKIQRRPRGYK
jgi:alanyl-tRNA synthetase